MKRVSFILSFLLLSIAPVAFAQKVAVLSDLKFDDSTVLVGIPSSSNPVYGRHLAFIIATKKDFDQLRQDWVFEEKSYGKKPNYSITIYLVKNKEADWVGSIYPSLGKLTMMPASYGFDTLKLIDLVKKHPFHYQRKMKAFKNRAEYLKAYHQAVLDPKCLFTFGPGKWDGSFHIAVPVSDSVNSPVAAMDKLTVKLSAFADSDSYSLRYELMAGNMDYKKSFFITVDCIQSVYDKYSDPVFVKSDWKPETIFMSSFWRE